MLFKLEENVPDVYVEMSRDFQLLCRVYNILVNSNIITQSKIRQQLNIEQIDDKLLKLLAGRLGFSSDNYIPTKVMRSILLQFPFMIKNKGTKVGIEQAIRSVIKQTSRVNSVYVSDITIATGEIKVTVKSDDAGAVDMSYLSNVLKYVVPIGYTVTIAIEETENNPQRDIDNNIVQFSMKKLKTRNTNLSKIVKQQLIKF